METKKLYMKKFEILGLHFCEFSFVFEVVRSRQKEICLIELMAC